MVSQEESRNKEKYPLYREYFSLRRCNSFSKIRALIFSKYFATKYSLLVTFADTIFYTLKVTKCRHIKTSFLHIIFTHDLHHISNSQNIRTIRYISKICKISAKNVIRRWLLIQLLQLTIDIVERKLYASFQNITFITHKYFKKFVRLKTIPFSILEIPSRK